MLCVEAMRAQPIGLSVNLNKVALLRNSRGAANPSPRVAGVACLEAGAAGLTPHWRADSRHTRADDVRAPAPCAPSAAPSSTSRATSARSCVALAEELRRHAVHAGAGAARRDHERLRLGPAAPARRGRPDPGAAAGAGLRAAIFVGADPAMMAAAAATGADRVEIYTEPYAAAWGTPQLRRSWRGCRATARAAAAAGLGVNAGHDLDLRNLPLLAREVPELAEVSIGHALLADALYLGLGETVQRYVRACRGEAVDAPVTSRRRLRRRGAAGRGSAPARHRGLLRRRRAAPPRGLPSRPGVRRAAARGARSGALPRGRGHARRPGARRAGSPAARARPAVTIRPPRRSTSPRSARSRPSTATS